MPRDITILSPKVQKLIKSGNKEDILLGCELAKQQLTILEIRNVLYKEYITRTQTPILLATVEIERISIYWDIWMEYKG